MYSNNKNYKNKQIIIIKKKKKVLYSLNRNDGSLLNPSNFVRGDFILINTKKK